MAIAATLTAAAPYAAAALEIAKWAIDYRQRIEKGELTEAEMQTEWEANVRADVRNANALWQASKRRQEAF